MIDPERIQRLAAKMGNRKDALEFVRQMRCGGKKFDEGGYKDRLVNWSVNHPGALWADTEEAAKAREWLRKNAPEELSALYWNESDDIRKGIDRRFVPDDAKEKEMQFNVTSGISDAGRNIADKVEDVAAWLPGPIGTGVWLGNTAGDISDGNYGKAALDLGLMALMGGAGHYAGKVIGKYAPRLMQKFPRLGKALDFLDDITWNDARGAEASDLWSRNLDARQAFGVAPESIDPVTGVSSGLIYGPREVSISHDDARDVVSNELFLRWLKINDPAMHDSLLKDRRLRHISKRMLEGSDVKKYVSPDIYQQMLDGTFPWENSKYIEKYFPTEEIIDGSGRNVFWDWREKMRDAISPISGFDVPLGYNVLPFTDKLQEFVKVRDAAYDIMKARAAAGEMSPVVQPLIKDVNDATWIMGKMTYPTTETSFSKPAIHFTDTQLDDSFSHGNSVTIGLRDYFDPAMDQHDWFHSHYGKDIFADPYFIIGHEVGHRHPGFNTRLSKQAREAIKGKTNLARDIVFMRNESPRYGITYYGLNGKARTALTPTRTIDPVIDPHDAEFAEWFSDKLGDATMMKMCGINDGTRPYTMKDLDRLTKKMEELYGKGAKTRFSWFFETPEARLNALNNGWANGGQMNVLDGGGRYYKVPTPIVDGQNAGNYVDEQPNYSDGMFGGIDVSGFYDAMGRLRMPLPEVQAAKVEPIRVDTTPEWYNMVPLLYDVPTGFYPGINAETSGGLFSEEAKARRKIKQRYAESKFNDRAESKAGARGAWQIMPITYKDYLGRGRGKEGDLYDAKFNEKIRDWVMGIIPRDLQEFWSDDDSDINKLAKLYAAYNWGAGSLRNFFRKRQNAGLSNDDPYEWVEGLNPETKRYVKYLAFDEDFDEGTGYTTKQFEDAAKARGYMAEGGRLFGKGGDKDPIELTDEITPSVVRAYEPLYVDTPYTTDDFFKRWYPNRTGQLVDNMAKLREYATEWPFGQKKRARKNVDGYVQSMLKNMDENLHEYSLIRSIWDCAYPHNSAYDPNRKWIFPDALKDEEARGVLEDHIRRKNDVLRSYGVDVKSDDEKLSDDDLRGEGWNAYGFSYADDPYHIFYTSAWPGNGTIVHERTHTLRPLPGEYEKYVKAYGNNPMEHAAYMIKRGQYDYNGWTGKTKDNLFTEAGRNEEDIAYYSNPHEIVARLNTIRFNLGINPRHIVTAEDLKEIRSKASKKDREEFLDLYTDEALLRFFNEVADAGNQESLYGNHLGNVSASGGKIRIKPENCGKFTALLKRTGKSASWFKEHGTPAQKKMATFALNSRHWGHRKDDGGPIDRYSPEQIRAAIARLKEMNK